MVQLFFIGFALAQDKTSDLKKLVELMGSEKMIDEMIDKIVKPTLEQQAKELIQGDNAKEKYDDYIEFILYEVKELSKLLNEEMVGIYDEYFTHEEIKDLIIFYESPTGKKMLEKQPNIMGDLMNSSMTKHFPEFLKRLKKKLDELR